MKTINVSESSENRTPQRLGNIYGEQFGTGYAGNVWDDDGISPAIMTCQGGGRQPMVISHNTPIIWGGLQKHQVPRLDNRSPTLNAAMGMGGGQTPLVYEGEIMQTEENGKTEYRIRRLTPRETWRLQDFTDEQFDNAQAAGISATQLYKMAGNSITVGVLYYIYHELYKVMPYLFDDLKVGSFFSGIGAYESGLDRFYADINDKNFC